MDGNQAPSEQSELPTPIQPGQTVSPGQAPAPVPQAPAPENSPVAPSSLPNADPVPVETTPVQVPASSPAPSQPTYWVSEEEENNPPAPADGGNVVSWTASEYIAHEKSRNWYVLLLGSALVAAVVVWLITKDIVSPIVILIAVGVFAAYARRQPRELQYTLDATGITIGEKRYPYANFRSFSVVDDGTFTSIELLPLKRFSPPLAVYYDSENEEAIAQALTPHLPFQPREQDPIDKLMRRIRF